MMKKLYQITLSICLMLPFSALFAQKLGSMVQVETRDNNRIKGKLVEKTATHFTLETLSTGNISIERSQIRSIEEVRNSNTQEAIKTSKFLNENSHASRNFMTPTAFGLRKGEGYYKNSMLVFNSVNYGFTNRFSLGVGFDWIGILSSDAGNTPVFTTLNAKFSGSFSKNGHIAGGINVWRIRDFIGDGTSAFIALPYIVTTFGNRDQNFTIGGGLIKPLNISTSDVPFALTLSGQIRLSERFSLISENWLMMGEVEGEQLTIQSLGLRYMSRTVAFDVALLRIPESDISDSNILPFPFMSVTFPF